DLLVVPAPGDEPWEGGWFAPLNRAIYPPIGARRVAARGPKCPAFKSKDSVLQRPNDETASATTVSPGLHQFAADGYSVVWWARTPAGGLVLDEKPTFGVRREDLIVKDVPKNVVADGRGRYDRWQLARHDARAQGAAPSLRIHTAHEWVPDDEQLAALNEQLTAIEIIRPDRLSGGGRPGRPWFGGRGHAPPARPPARRPPPPPPPPPPAP